MEVHVNVEQKTLHRRTGNVIEDNIQNQEERENIKKIMQGRKLQYQDANKFILILPIAMIVGKERKKKRINPKMQGKGKMDKHSHRPKAKPKKLFNSQGPVGQQKDAKPKPREM